MYTIDATMRSAVLTLVLALAATAIAGQGLEGRQRTINAVW